MTNAPPGAVRAALQDAAPRSFWLDSPDAPHPEPPLVGQTSADLVIVGGGYTGLWTALQAKEREPAREVLLLEGRTVGGAASGRNGGFCAASLTHGIDNGMSRFPDDMAALERLGAQNLAAIERTIARYGITCGFERTGELAVATAPHQIEWLRESVELANGFGHDAQFLEQSAVRAQVASPTYLAGAWHRDRMAMLDPARLAWGLRGACLLVGVRIAEHTPVLQIGRDGAGVQLRTTNGAVRAHRTAVATNAFPGLLRRMRPFTVPVYDYVLVTEPLSDAQLASIGWQNRQGIGDVANQFHYYRLTADNRILWGGYDEVYYWRNGLRDELDQRPQTFRTLAEHLPATRGTAVQPLLGWGDRHLDALLCLPAHGHGRTRRVQPRLHRSRRRCGPLRRSSHARPAGWARQRGAAVARGAVTAVAVPTGTAALGRNPAHPPRAR